MTKSNEIPKKPVWLKWDDDVAEAEQVSKTITKTMTRDCGVGSGADMPHNVWIVIRKSHFMDVIPVGAFCNKRFAEFWIKNQSEEDKQKWKYIIYPAIGNPEVFERISEQ